MTLRIFDLYERVVREIESAGILKPGEHQLSWDGHDGNGKAVPGEAYHYTLEAKSEDGSTITHDLTDITVGDVYAVKDVNWDKEKNKLQYTLTKPARINLRAGISNHGPLLKTLLDWVPQQSGKHELEWDGWDESKVLNVAKHPKLEFRASAFNLPRNTIFVVPLTNKIDKEVVIEGKVQRRLPNHPRPIRMHDYARQPAEERRDVPLILKLTQEYAKDSDGVAKVKGKVPIRVDVADTGYTALSKQRFEPVFFVDGVFLSEIEAGFLPTTFVWDSSKYNPGVHYLTVNIVGFDGAKGSATIKLQVEE